MHQELRRLLLLLALGATQLLSALGFALRWLGHALEDLAASARASATSKDATAGLSARSREEHQPQRLKTPLLLRDALPSRLGNGSGDGRTGNSAPAAPSALCYADAAGAALPPDALLDEVCEELKRTLYTNPHSAGEGAGAGAGAGAGTASSSSSSRLGSSPSASSKAAADECRAATLALLRAPPDEYSVVFTSGATAALALVADAFPWERGAGGAGASEEEEEEEREEGEEREGRGVGVGVCGGGGGGGGSSRFLYTRDNHTSVLGLRSAALAAGASATPVAIESGGGGGRWLLSRAGATMERRDENSTPSSSSSRLPRVGNKVPCLFAFPLESNFSGVRYSERAGESLRPPGRSAEVDGEEEENEEEGEEGGGGSDGEKEPTSFEFSSSSASRDSSPESNNVADDDDDDWSVVEVQKQRKKEEEKKKRRGGGERRRKGETWFVLADGAKAATAGCGGRLPDLSACPVDFLCLSFYKLFGYPTGLGALVASRRGLEALRRGRQGLGLGLNVGSSPSSSSRFFGGGTVLQASASADAVSLRPGVAGLEDGTPAFLAIAALRVAFRHFARDFASDGAGAAPPLSPPPPPPLRAAVEAAGARALAAASALASGLLSLRHADGSRVAVVYGSYEGASEVGNEEESGVPLWARGGAPLEKSRGSAAVVGQGAVVAFNLLRPRRSSSSSSSSSPSSVFSQRAVGHREVERLASLHGVLLRGGTLCNPGAAELALGPPSTAAETETSAAGSDRERERGEEAEEEVDCREGSGLDAKGNPTGVLRASFGAGASAGDAAAALGLVRRYFVDAGAAAVSASSSPPSPPSPPPSSSLSAAPPVVVTELFVYPVKGAAGFSPPTSSWPLRGGREGGGLAFDREFAVVDADAAAGSPSSLSPSSLRRRLVTPRRCPRLAQLRTFIDLKQRHLVLTMATDSAANSSAAAEEKAETCLPLVVPLDDDESGKGEPAAAAAEQRSLASSSSSWLTAALGMPCSLARAPKESPRGWANEGDLLLVGRGSLAALRGRLAASAASADAAAAASAPERFRPNLVVDRFDSPGGMEPHEEDSWASLRGGGGEAGGGAGAAGELVLVAAGGCARCPAVNVDRSSGSKIQQQQQLKQQPLLELAGYRRSVATGRIEFGVLLQRRPGPGPGALGASSASASASATEAEGDGARSSAAAGANAASSFCPWIAVGDVLVPTLRDPAVCCPAGGGASCA